MLYELPSAAVGEQVITLVEAAEGRLAVRLHLVPIGPSALRAARLALVDDGQSNDDHPIEEYAKDRRFDAFCRELCQRSIVRWEGIGKNGVAAPLDEANLRALLTDAKVLGQLQAEFVLPFLAREAEKNGSAPSSAGTLPVKTGAKGIAPGAPRAAKRARTRSTPRNPGKGK